MGTADFIKSKPPDINHRLLNNHRLRGTSPDLEKWSYIILMSKADLLLTSLTRFFDIPENREKLHSILGGGSGPSLRKLEWFVTNYAKNQHVSYVAPNGKMFTVHVAYKSSLDGYSKKLFDPFCRTERIQFQGLTTTVAQLNFIRWVLTNGIIEYIKYSVKTQTLPETAEECTHNKTRTDCIPGPSVVHTKG